MRLTVVTLLVFSLAPVFSARAEGKGGIAPKPSWPAALRATLAPAAAQRFAPLAENSPLEESAYGYLRRKLEPQGLTPESVASRPELVAAAFAETVAEAFGTARSVLRHFSSENDDPDACIKAANDAEALLGSMKPDVDPAEIERLERIRPALQRQKASALKARVDGAAREAKGDLGGALEDSAVAAPETPPTKAGTPQQALDSARELSPESLRQISGDEEYNEADKSFFKNRWTVITDALSEAQADPASLNEELAGELLETGSQLMLEYRISLEADGRMAPKAKAYWENAARVFLVRLAALAGRGRAFSDLRESVGVMYRFLDLDGGMMGERGAHEWGALLAECEERLDRDAPAFAFAELRRAAGSLAARYGKLVERESMQAPARQERKMAAERLFNTLNVLAR